MNRTEGATRTPPPAVRCPTCGALLGSGGGDGAPGVSAESQAGGQDAAQPTAGHPRVDATSAPDHDEATSPGSPAIAATTPPVPSSVGASRTSLDDADATSPGVIAASSVVVPQVDGDPDATRPGAALPATAPVAAADDADATRPGTPLPALPAPFDPDATRPGAVIVPQGRDDETRPGTPPPVPPSRTVVGSRTVLPRSGASLVARTLPSSRGGNSIAASRVFRGTQLGPPSADAEEAVAAVDTAADLVGQQLGYRYQILRLLGAGGMGAVYQAWDEVLSVVVALKTVRPEVAADPETARMLERRFKQELLLARRVTHKNIVRVHDMGDVGGIKYITMPFLEGEELSAILKRDGKLPVPRVMKLARSIASGLVAAHQAGVVHRDLKPANIMVDAEGEGLIMDFGVARSTGDPAALSKDRADGKSAKDAKAGAPRDLHPGHTQAGSIVGTVEYMAPEQARAQPVDQRADIYAFGLMLYDLLLGRRQASQTQSAIEELKGRMEQAPAPARSKDASIPEALDRIITRCIQPDAEARYQTISEVLAELDKLDAAGKPLPMVRRLTPAMMAAAAATIVALIGTTWWLARSPAVPVEHEPVSVLISDLQNTTGDATFDRTLEPMMKLALEGAGFISAYDRDGIRRSLGVRPPETLDERAALELAVKQGVNVVLSGTISREGSGYGLSLKATQAVTGTVLTDARERASNREQVLGAATTLSTNVREALGDESTDSAQRFAMETLSATSLEAVREYATGMEALSRSRFEEALAGFSRAVAIDPKFGSAYAGMAIASRNLDKHQNAQRYLEEALGHLDSMTERERYRTRGLYYFVTNDYQACVKEFGDLIARFSSDVSARNNRAVCLTNLRNIAGAVEEMRQTVKILPNRALYQENLAQYLAYSGDFDAAEQQVRAMQAPGLFGLLPLAFAQYGRGDVARAAETFRSLGGVDEQGASYTASGLGDLAIYQGRYSEALKVLSAGAEADLASKDPDRAANKLLALAHAHLLRQKPQEAVAAAEKALANSNAVKVRFLAARAFVEAGATERAGALSAGLGSELQAEPQAYAAIIDGMTALKNGNPRKAIKELTDANNLLDMWIGHFEIGRAYLQAGLFLQADSEFDRCIKRRGEALSLFLDEEPTYRFFPPVLYYQGKVRDGLKSGKAVESYREYLKIRGTSPEDPLVPEVQRRVQDGEAR